MVNVALLVVAGATFLNSISVILLAVYARKKEKEIRKLKLEQDKMWKSTTENIWVSDQSRDKQIENLRKDLKDMYMERSVVRNISVPKKYFMGGSWLLSSRVKRFILQNTESARCQ